MLFRILIIKTFSRFEKPILVAEQDRFPVHTKKSKLSGHYSSIIESQYQIYEAPMGNSE